MLTSGQGTLKRLQLQRRPLIKKVSTLAGAMGLLLVVTGCGGSDGSDYDSLLELRDAAIEAGLQCDDWERVDENSGSCGEDVVMSFYEDEEERKREVEETLDTFRDLAILDDRINEELEPMEDALGMEPTDDITPIDVPLTPRLVKDNWVITSADAVDLQDKLGGEVITSY